MQEAPRVEAYLNNIQAKTVSQMTSRRKWMLGAGWGMSGLMIAFLLFDSLSKLALERHVVEATTHIGYPAEVIRPLGAIALVCTALYAIPRTAVLGAILLTAYLGGAVASKVRIEDPLFSSTLFGVYFGLLLWGGLYLRDERLRALIPVSRGLLATESTDAQGRATFRDDTAD